MTDDPTSTAALARAVFYLRTAAAFVAIVDAAGILAAIDHEETVGPIADPTQYRDTMKSRIELRAMAEGALAFQRALARQEAR